MTHPMSEPWLDWQPIATFPRDEECYLVTDKRLDGGFAQIVYWNDGHLSVPDASISYSPGAFTHWSSVPQPSGHQ